MKKRGLVVYWKGIDYWLLWVWCLVTFHFLLLYISLFEFCFSFLILCQFVIVWSSYIIFWSSTATQTLLGKWLFSFSDDFVWYLMFMIQNIDNFIRRKNYVKDKYLLRSCFDTRVMVEYVIFFLIYYSCKHFRSFSIYHNFVYLSLFEIKMLWISIGWMT